MSSKYSKKPVKPQKEESALMQVAKYILHAGTGLYFIAMMVIYPLIYHNKYYDMGDAKYNYFKWSSIIFLGILILGFALWMAANLHEESFAKIFKRFSVTDWFVTGFWIISYFSFLFSEQKSTAFWGFSGWYMGLFSQTVFVLLYFFFSRWWDWNPLMIGLAMGTGAIAYLIAIAQRFGFDILGMYENLGAEYIEKFVSTLGQTTWYSSYAMLIFPVGVFWYFYDEKIWARVFSGIFVFTGVMSICTVNSDSAYISLVLVFMVFFWFAFDSNKRMLRFLELAILVVAAFRTVGLVYSIFPEREIQHISDSTDIADFVSKSNVVTILLAVLAVIYIAYRLILKLSYDERMDKYSFDIGKFKILRVLMLIMATLVIGGVVMAIILVTKGMLPESMNAINNVAFFNFVDAWGNHRGFNWRMAIEALTHASAKDLFIGVGPDCFALAMDKYCMAQVNTYWHGLKLACAHNEWLNMLVTEGVLGVVAYTGIFVSEAVRLGKCAAKEPAAMMILAAIVSYMGHNIFCYQQCICSPTIFLLMGIGEMIIIYTKKNAKQA